MCPRHFAPYHPYLGPSYLSLPTVDICYTLAQVEFGGVRVVDAFDFDEGGVGVGVPLMRKVSNYSLLCRDHV